MMPFPFGGMCLGHSHGPTPDIGPDGGFADTAQPPAVQNQIALAFLGAYGDYSYAYTLPTSSAYGWRRHPIQGRQDFHDGIDLPLPLGTPILSIWPGQVVRVDQGHRWNGNAVFIASPDKRWQVAYLHLDRVLVHKGQLVDQGQQIGTCGQTGSATGPHLHFEIKFDGKSVDPLALYPGGLFRPPGR